MVLLIGGLVALASAVASLLLIRTKDFEASSQRGHDDPGRAGMEAEAVPEGIR